MDIEAFTQQHGLDANFTASAQHWFIPLAEELVLLQKGAKRPFFIAINGAQGSGKSTLADFLTWYFRARSGMRVATLSLDDVYLSQAARIQRAADIHPLLRVRGVPGTHDTQLLKDCLQALAVGQPVLLPRFNKAYDNPVPVAQWPSVTGAVDMVIMEGWCWGVSAQEANALTTPINALEKTEDQDGTWRQYVNTRLQCDYMPLYAMFDYWIMLQAPSFAIVRQWRLQQEQHLAKQQPNAPFLMHPTEIARFVQFFERLTTHGLATLPPRCNSVYALDDNRKIIAHRQSRNL